MVCASSLCSAKMSSDFAVVMLRPNLRVGPGVDQLRIDPHAVARYLHASHQHIADAELTADFPRISHLATIGRDTRFGSSP